MAPDVSSPTRAPHPAPTEPRTAARKQGRQDREHLLEGLNQAVRRPQAFGGLAALPLLLDQLAASEQPTTGTRWIPDTNARLSPAAMLRHLLNDPENHVTASQYGEDAHRQGWLRLDRTLTAKEHTALTDRATAWSQTDRSEQDILAEFGPASVTFGAPDPQCPKTLSYTSSDRNAPMVAFHLGTVPPAGTTPSSSEPVPAGTALLAVRSSDDFFHGWELTPHGEALL